MVLLSALDLAALKLILNTKNYNMQKDDLKNVSTGSSNTLLPTVYPLIDNHRWYAENGTVYNESDEEVRIVLLHNSGSYTNLPHEIAIMIASALNSR